MLTETQMESFEANGFVRVPGAFSKQQAGAMTDRVWEKLHDNFGVARGDPETWRTPLAKGLQPLKQEAVFAPIGSEATLGAIADVMGDVPYEMPAHWGTLLVTFPDQSGLAWDVPQKVWHTDFAYGPSPSIHGALVFSMLSDIPASHGGTTVIAGSPRLIAGFLEKRPQLRDAKMKTVRRKLMESNPWLRALGGSGADNRVARFMERESEVAGVPLRVVELTGVAGDVVICHPWILHTAAPNRGDKPRIMCVQRIAPKVA